MKEKIINELNKNIKKILIIIAAIITILLMKSSSVLAEISAYYLGSKDVLKATSYEKMDKDENGAIEVDLDLSQTLDKMLYYILTYEEYDNKTFIGDINETNIESKKQSAIYYLIHNYKQAEIKYGSLTNNEELKNVLSNYAGNGNNLSEFDSSNRNGAQIIYGLSEAWAKGKDINQTAKKLKLNYRALASEKLKYWASITDEPLEGTIYNPEIKSETLAISIYVPNSEEKTASNAIRVEEKVIENNTENSQGEDMSATISDKVIMNLGKPQGTINGKTVTYDINWNHGVPEHYYCLDETALVVESYTLEDTCYIGSDDDKKRYTEIFERWETDCDITRERVWKNLNTSGELNAAGFGLTGISDVDGKWVVGYYLFKPETSFEGNLATDGYNGGELGVCQNHGTAHKGTFYVCPVYGNSYAYFCQVEKAQPLIQPIWANAVTQVTPTIKVQKVDKSTGTAVEGAKFKIGGTDGYITKNRRLY